MDLHVSRLYHATFSQRSIGKQAPGRPQGTAPRKFLASEAAAEGAAGTVASADTC